MITQSKLKHIKISARKVRIVADLVRGKNVNKALNILNINKKRGALFITRALKNAINNVGNIKGNAPDIDSLYIAEIFVDEGPTAKRWLPRAMGRATPIHKRTSHLTLRLDEKQ